MAPLSLFLTSILVLSCVTLSPSSASNETDRLSLMAFKNEIKHDPDHVLSSWNDSLHFCNWFGVTCNHKHGRVTVLDLHSTRIAGALTSHVGNMSFLKVLDLRNNSFTNEIPQELGRLVRLQKLGLTNNTFSGEITVNLSRCINLKYLDIGGNNLTGKIPVELGLLKNLEVLHFYKNNLIGEIPSSLGNLTWLQSISGSLNYLTGSIPYSFGQFKNLSFLAFGGNSLSGTIPHSIFNVSSITVFSLPVNQLEGTLPRELGISLPNLESFKVHTNRLTGVFPVTISNASKLLSLQFSGNSFTGKVPNFVGLNDLRVLSLDENNFGFNRDDDLDFLSALVNCTNLETLVISDNNLGGVLPEYLSNFSSKLSKIGFGRNHIHGTIPSEIGNLVGLEALGLESNLLTGIIPNSISKLLNLHSIFFNMNQLSGTIPPSIGNLTSLGRINLRLNNLEGSIPPSIGNYQYLLNLYLSQNKLSGSIPKELMNLRSLSIDLYLSDNRLTGSIPLEIGNLVSVGILDFSENRLSGELPITIGKCISLEHLNLHGNFLEGTIPLSLSSLRAIQTLDLSHNNFSGQIPKFFGDFRLLQSLNLSFNNLEGKVPEEGVFKNASAVFLEGNGKLCGGISQLNQSKCENRESKRQKAWHKLILATALTFGILGLILSLSFLVWYWSRKRKDQVSGAASTLGISCPRVTYGDLFKATDGFSSRNLIGVGSFGSVYKGVLYPQEEDVAVKVLNLERKGASKSFMAECEALRNIRHVNLVKIVTVCSSIDFIGNGFKALVYELMVNGSLEEWLHPVYKPQDLNLSQRLNIAIDVANALDYLHNQCEWPVVHCDLKPSNVLLDSDMTACLGDFGLAKFLPEAFQQLYSNNSNSFEIKGTIGYAAPEYGMGSEVSTWGDVYSFGILLLEMFTGRRPTDDLFKDGLDLRRFASTALPDQVTNIVDPFLLVAHEEASTRHMEGQYMSRQEISECLALIIGIGVSCSSELPRERIDMSRVVVELNRARDILVQAGEGLTHAYMEIREEGQRRP